MTSNFGLLEGSNSDEGRLPCRASASQWLPASALFGTTSDKKQKTPAKRITTDARSWVAANANRGPLN